MLPARWLRAFIGAREAAGLVAGGGRRRGASACAFTRWRWRWFVRTLILFPPCTQRAADAASEVLAGSPRLRNRAATRRHGGQSFTSSVVMKDWHAYFVLVVFFFLFRFNSRGLIIVQRQWTLRTESFLPEVESLLEETLGALFRPNNEKKPNSHASKGSTFHIIYIDIKHTLQYVQPSVWCSRKSLMQYHYTLYYIVGCLLTCG